MTEEAKPSNDAVPLRAPVAPHASEGGAEATEDAGRLAAPGRKPYRTVLLAGDSMVGGGLARALEPRFTRSGAVFFHDTWEAASIVAFDNTERFAELLSAHDPDVVLVTLGSNDVFDPHPEGMIRHIESIVRKVGPRDCYWLGPPLWKPDRGLVEVIRTHVAPCKFYDSSALKLPRAADGIHPTDAGGELWARRFWSFFRPRPAGDDTL